MHPVQFRTIEIDLARAGDDDVIPAVLSSETPVERGDHVEILEHTPESIDLGRAPIPLIEGHDASRTNIGIVEELKVEGGKLRGMVRFGKSARAREVLADVRAGIVRSLSIGYRIKKWRNEGRRLISTLTEVLEVSVVPVPADPQAGFFRSLSMTDSTIALTGESAAAARAERERCAAITDLATRHNKRQLGDQAIAEGMPLEQFRGLILDQVANKPLAVDTVDMSPGERGRYSLMRVVRALADPTRYGREAGLEAEVSREMARLSGREPRGYLVPLDMIAKRDLSTSIASGTSKAGYTVETAVYAEQFIDVLRNASVAMQAGARSLNGLQGNVTIPRRTAGVTASWIAEGSAASEGSNTFDQITMSPKTVSAWLDVTRRLMIQGTPAADQLVRDDLVQSLMLAVDEAALGAGGTNKPTGIRGTSGIGSVVMGTNGGAPTWASVVNLVKEVAIDNALTGNLAYVTNEKVRSKLAQTPKQSSGVEANFILASDVPDRLFGYRFLTSNAIPSNLTKGSASGVCSAMLFGNFDDLVIGFWSGVDIIVDPYTQSTTGTTRIVGFQDVDCAVRHPESFAAVLDYTTT